MVKQTIKYCNYIYFSRNLKDGIDVCKEVVDHNLPAHVTISFNPINWKQLLLYGDERIRLWSVETCDTQMLLTSM